MWFTGRFPYPYDGRERGSRSNTSEAARSPCSISSRTNRTGSLRAPKVTSGTRPNAGPAKAAAPLVLNINADPARIGPITPGLLALEISNESATVHRGSTKLRLGCAGGKPKVLVGDCFA